MQEVKVTTAGGTYTIYIGQQLSDQLEKLIKAFSFSRKALLVADTNTAKLYGRSVLTVLEKAGLSVRLFTVEAGEQSKCFTVAEALYTVAIEEGLDRQSPVIALGGGVVGDLTGFIAATYLRGVPFIQLPTSLLAQVDSSVGGKVAINHALGKNLIGAFYQPMFVNLDLDLLKTLPPREIYSGLAEIIKYGVIFDDALFQYLEKHDREILELETDCMAHIVKRSCEIKADVVSKDERESGLRMILNFGHTIAHAIESDTGYVKYNHGEAVAIGMHGAALLSHDFGLTDEYNVARITQLLEKYHLPLYAADCRPENLLEILKRDKKAFSGNVRWILLRGIGEVEIQSDVPEELVLKTLRRVTKMSSEILTGI